MIVFASPRWLRRCRNRQKCRYQGEKVGKAKTRATAEYICPGARSLVQLLSNIGKSLEWACDHFFRLNCKVRWSKGLLNAESQVWQLKDLRCKFCCYIFFQSCAALLLLLLLIIIILNEVYTCVKFKLANPQTYCAIMNNQQVSVISGSSSFRKCQDKVLSYTISNYFMILEQWAFSYISQKCAENSLAFNLHEEIINAATHGSFNNLRLCISSFDRRIVYL